MVKPIRQRVLSNRGVVDIDSLQPGDWVFDAFDGSSVVIADKLTEPNTSEWKVRYSDWSEFIYGGSQKIVVDYRRTGSSNRPKIHLLEATAEGILTSPSLLTRRIDRIKYSKFVTDDKHLTVGMDMIDFYASGALLMYGLFSIPYANISEMSNYVPLQEHIDVKYSWHLKPDNGLMVVHDKFGNPVTWGRLFNYIGIHTLSDADARIDSYMDKFLFCEEDQRMRLIRSVVDAGFFYNTAGEYDTSQIYFNINGSKNLNTNYSFHRILSSMGIINEVVWYNSEYRINIMSGRISTVTGSEEIIRKFSNDDMCCRDTNSECSRSIFVVHVHHLMAYENDEFTVTRLIPYDSTHRHFLSDNLLPLAF